MLNAPPVGPERTMSFRQAPLCAASRRALPGIGKLLSGWISCRREKTSMLIVRRASSRRDGSYMTDFGCAEARLVLAGAALRIYIVY